ncbi:hypothetical protein FF021_17055 [Leptospira noguchii]|nr:hypothetical protein FF021_17055 [Leptospira noguchii]
MNRHLVFVSWKRSIEAILLILTIKFSTTLLLNLWINRHLLTVPKMNGRFCEAIKVLKNCTY